MMFGKNQPGIKNMDRDTMLLCNTSPDNVGDYNDVNYYEQKNNNIHTLQGDLINFLFQFFLLLYLFVWTKNLIINQFTGCACTAST